MNRFLVPLCFVVMLCSPGYSQNNQLNRLFISTSLLLLCQFNKPLKLDVHHFLFFAWLLWASIGTYLSDYQAMAFQGFYPYRCEGLLTYLVITAIAVAYWKTFDSIRPLAWACLFMCIALTVCHKFLIHYDPLGGFIMPSKDYYDRLFIPDLGISAFACVSAPLIMIISPVLAITAVLPIYASGTRIALLGAFLACSGFIYAQYWNRIKFKKLAAYALIGLIGLFVLTKLFHVEPKLTRIPDFTQFKGTRPQWILQAYRLSQSLPLFGFGLDTQSNYLSTPTLRGYEDIKKYIPDRVHFYPLDMVLQTGWIGYTLLLLSLGYALAICIKHGTTENLACGCVLLSFVLFGLANPHGMLAESITLTALMGIKK